MACMSSESASISSDKQHLLTGPVGSRKVHYQPSSEWDFICKSHQEVVDLSLALPHFRARNQPVGERLSMFVSATDAPVKVKVCRGITQRSKFLLDIRGSRSNICIWLPSDFRGYIRCASKAVFSAGFANRIMPNVQMRDTGFDGWHGDEVVVETSGTVTFRMWDVHTGAPEVTTRETLKRIFGSKKASGSGINWDFLLDG